MSICKSQMDHNYDIASGRCRFCGLTIKECEANFIYDKSEMQFIPIRPDAWLEDFAKSVQGTAKERSSEQRKAEPIHSGVLRYFPDALAAVSRVSKAGNDKHNPGQPLHWARGKSNDHLDCVARHIITPKEIDPESGEYHLAHAAWRVLAALQLMEEKKLAQRGIRNLSGATNEQ